MLQDSDRKYIVRLLWLFAAQLGIYGWLVGLSNAFRLGGENTARPLLLVLSLFTVCFVLHLLALWQGLKARNSSALLGVVVLGAMVFRGVMVLSEPIQEVDIYRYCWDGAVLNTGVSPFRYSPTRVLTANNGPDNSFELQRLLALRDSDPHLRTVLARVHFGELTTIYPPVSQFVFALSDFATPHGAPVRERLRIMKTLIVLFDLLTLAVLSRLLALLGMHQAWTLPHAWSPLLVKEFANSGHLDSIAVFCCTMAVFQFCRYLRNTRASLSPLVWSTFFLAAGVGAKLYPVVLVPAIAWCIYRRQGLAKSFLWCVMASLSIFVLLAPMLWEMRHEAPDARPPLAAEVNQALPPLPSFTDPDAGVEQNDGKLSAGTNQDVGTLDWESFEEQLPTLEEPPPLPNDDGLVEFLSRWEMNDLLFMVVEENFRAEFRARARPWFVFAPEGLRKGVCEGLAVRWGISEGQVPFRLTRILTLIVFCSLSAWVILGVRMEPTRSGEENCREFLRCSFLILAWFWLLSPTQNPWYWSWALPLVVFAGSRVWLAMAGLVMTYYMRFWFLYHFSEIDVLGSGYFGTDFFDFVVVWLEFGPWLFALLFFAWRSRSPR